MSAAHEWAKELVCDWAAKTDDVELLRAWFDACRKRLAMLGAARRGISLEPGADVYANGTVYVIERVEEDNEVIDVTPAMSAKRVFAAGRERVIVFLCRTGPSAKLAVCTSMHDGFACTLPARHHGEHIALGFDAEVFARWPQP